MPVSALHRQLATIALGAAARYGFALAGGNALIAHGVVNRFTADLVMQSVKVSMRELSQRETSAVLSSVCSIERRGCTLSLWPLCGQPRPGLGTSPAPGAG